MAHGLPVEGEQADALTAGSVARQDVVTCHLDQPVGPVRERVEASSFGFALVTSPAGVLLGRLRREALEGDPAAMAESVMEPGPSTVRPDTAAGDLLERLRKRDLRTAIVSTPEGRLSGVVRRSDLEAALEGWDAPG